MEIFIKEDLIDLYRRLIATGDEIYMSQDGLTMDVYYLGKTFRITSIQVEDYILVTDIKEV